MLRLIREVGMVSFKIMGPAFVVYNGLTMFSSRLNRADDRQKLKKVTSADSDLKISVYEFKRDKGIDDLEWNIRHGEELTIEDESWNKKVTAAGKNEVENYKLLKQTLKCLAKTDNVDEYDKCASKSKAPAFK